MNKIEVFIAFIAIYPRIFRFQERKMIRHSV